MFQRTYTKNAMMFQLSICDEYIHITSLIILCLLFSGFLTHVCCKRFMYFKLNRMHDCKQLMYIITEGVFTNESP